MPYTHAYGSRSRLMLIGSWSWWEGTMDDLKTKLLKTARAARTQAYANYSHFKVGAAILADDGKIYAGANVENASYPEGQCAETSAIGAMITGGGRRIREILIIADGPLLCTPCGGCRQRIREFADDETLVHIAGPEGHRQTFRFADLLPVSFSLRNLSERP
jgi:cytidine deaminase